jgi:hypothetical protein
MSLYPRVKLPRPFDRAHRLPQCLPHFQLMPNCFDSSCQHIIGRTCQPGLNGSSDSLFLLQLKLKLHINPYSAF